MTSHFISMEAITLRRTEKALLIRDHEGEEAKTVWLPLAEVRINGERDGVTDISIPRWLAEKKGLI